MKKNLLKTVCIMLVAVLCMGSLNAQNTGKQARESNQTTQVSDAVTKYTPSNRAVIYAENFESTTIDIDNGVLPTGWQRSVDGDFNWMVVNDQPNYAEYDMYNIPGVTNFVAPFEGSQFMALSWLDSGLGNWAISAGFPLTEGVEYEISFQLVMPGYPQYDETNSITVRIGSTPTQQAMATAHLLYSKTERITQWTLVTAQFTPTTTGTYYLFFHDSTPPADEGWGIYHGIDDIKVTDNAPEICEPIASLNVTYSADCKALLGWPAVAGAKSYNVYRDGELLENVSAGTTSYTDESFDPLSGYTWSIKTVCEDGETEAVEKEMPACANCAPVTDLVAAYKDAPEDCDVELTWIAPEGETKFNVYRDGNLITETPIEANTYTDSGFDVFVAHTWSVRVACTSGGESVAVSAGLENCKVGIYDRVKTTFTIVPNPATDKISITAASNFSKVEIVNFLGQTVFSQTTDKNSTTIDVANLHSGIYFVRIVSENGSHVQKFVKQ